MCNKIAFSAACITRPSSFPLTQKERNPYFRWRRAENFCCCCFVIDPLGIELYVTGKKITLLLFLRKTGKTTELHIKYANTMLSVSVGL